METPAGKYRKCLRWIGFRHGKKGIAMTKNGLNTNLSNPPPPEKNLNSALINPKCSIPPFAMFLKFSRSTYV